LHQAEKLRRKRVASQPRHDNIPAPKSHLMQTKREKNAAQNKQGYEPPQDTIQKLFDFAKHLENVF
jgi:hypothetical protein